MLVTTGDVGADEAELLTRLQALIKTANELRVMN
jgi:hypothetical protein